MVGMERLAKGLKLGESQGERVVWRSGKRFQMPRKLEAVVIGALLQAVAA